jgi:hypothetical protein
MPTSIHHKFSFPERVFIHFANFVLGALTPPLDGRRSTTLQKEKR